MTLPYPPPPRHRREKRHTPRQPEEGEEEQVKPLLLTPATLQPRPPSPLPLIPTRRQLIPPSPPPAKRRTRRPAHQIPAPGWAPRKSLGTVTLAGPSPDAKEAPSNLQRPHHPVAYYCDDRDDIVKSSIETIIFEALRAALQLQTPVYIPRSTQLDRPYGLLGNPFGAAHCKRNQYSS